MLKTEQNTPEIEREIRESFPLEVIFEHGQWWVLLGGFSFSVEDTSDGFILEQC